MSDEKKEKKDNGGLEEVARKAIEIAKAVAAEVRKLKEQLVNEGVISNPAATMSGAEAYRMKGKSGHVKVTALVGVAMLFAVITGGLFAANELVWKVGDSAYVDAEGDATFNSLTTVVAWPGSATLSVSNSANAGAATLTMQADKGDDAGDKFAIAAQDGGTLAIQSDVSVKGTLATKASVSNDGTINTLIGLDGIGIVDLDIGSADITDIQLITDGTGTAEVVLPDGSIDGTEILDGTIANADLSATAAIASTKLAAFTCTTITTNAYPITSANYNTMILVNTNAAVAITLPANGAAAGSWVDVAVHSSATDACAPTIATATADTLVIIGGIDGDSVTYGTGHRIGAYARFWSDGSFWHYVNMGPTTLTENDSD